MFNLNDVLIPNADSDGTPLKNYSVCNGSVQVFFRNLKEHLVEHIDEADYVFGCVAWLTDSIILETLGQKSGVSLLVQKEDFLRPDVPPADKQWSEKLRSNYKKLKSVCRLDYGQGVGSRLSMCGDLHVDAVRCVGMRNSDRTGPRMHHKFAVFGRADQDVWCKPYAVWTGSFNWTATAGRSFENAVVLRDQDIVDAFYFEHQQMLALSEPLDWESPYVEPEWRIGT